MKNGSIRWFAIGVGVALVAGVVASVIARVRRKSLLAEKDVADTGVIALASEETPQPVGTKV